MAGFKRNSKGQVKCRACRKWVRPTANGLPQRHNKPNGMNCEGRDMLPVFDTPPRKQRQLDLSQPANDEHREYRDAI